MDASFIGKVLASGNVADILAYDTRVLKRFRARETAQQNAFIEASNTNLASTHGLPVPRVFQVGLWAQQHWGIVMSRHDGPTLADLAREHTDRIPELIDQTVQLQMRVHAIHDSRFPAMKSRLASKIGVSPLSEDHRRRLLSALADMPEGKNLCHGDFHPQNIIATIDGPIIIDWLDATAGAPEADIARSFILLNQVRPDMADAYLERAIAVSGRDRAAIRSWLPLVAAARLTENAPEVDSLHEFAGRILSSVL